MRIRVVLVMVGMSLIAVVGVTLAQPEEPAKGGAITDPVALRVRLARMRAEVELLKVEHEVDTEILKDLKNLDMMKAAEPAALAEVENLKKTGQIPGADANELPNLALLGGGNLRDIQRQALKQEELANDLAARMARPILDQRRREFMTRTIELNEKQLGSVDVVFGSEADEAKNQVK